MLLAHTSSGSDRPPPCPRSRALATPPRRGALVKKRGPRDWFAIGLIAVSVRTAVRFVRNVYRCWQDELGSHQLSQYTAVLSSVGIHRFFLYWGTITHHTRWVSRRSRLKSEHKLHFGHDVYQIPQFRSLEWSNTESSQRQLVKLPGLCSMKQFNIFTLSLRSEVLWIPSLKFQLILHSSQTLWILFEEILQYSPPPLWSEVLWVSSLKFQHKLHFRHDIYLIP